MASQSGNVDAFLDTMDVYVDKLKKALDISTKHYDVLAKMNASTLTFYQALRRRLSYATADTDSVSARAAMTVLLTESEVTSLWERVHRLELLADALNTYSSRLEQELVDR